MPGTNTLAYYENLLKQTKRGLKHWPWPYPQTLDKAGKACQRQTLSYYEHS
jgi:hypothetical protein